MSMHYIQCLQLYFIGVIIWLVLCVKNALFVLPSRFGVNMEEFPVICRIEEALQNLPAFVAADCRNQPDTPGDMKV